MPIIIFKFDDFTKTSESWERVAEYGIKNNVKFSIGIIGKSLEDADQKTFDWIKTFYNTGIFEFWNHGYNHEKNKNGLEFFGTSADEQYSSLEKTQKLGEKKLGITFATFGAPWNKTDQNTIEALEKISEIKIWLHGDPICKSKICLRPSNMSCERLKDRDKFFVDLESFKSQYNTVKSREYLVLQFHPASWKKMNSVREFLSIVDYLNNDPDVKFMLPSQYATYKYKG